ncbi:MAG: DUF6151 family protein [Lysobacterales bacterium]
MTQDLDVQCACGRLRGIAKNVSAKNVNHCVCYCDDCQLFAHFLDKADRVLDDYGGTQIFQMSPRHFEFTAGQENLACVRLKPKGLYRWYARCCNTPLANTVTSDLPFIGLINPVLKQATEANVGPVKLRVHGRFARGDASAVGAHPKAPISGILAVLGRLLRNRLRGDKKRNALFDPNSGRPRVEPHTLAPEDLEQLIQARKCWMAAAPGTPLDAY